MANAPSAVDLNLTYAEQTAVVVSDGTYADVITTLKTDEPGLEAPATAISVASGQLWANFVDDYIRATWPLVQGGHVVSVQTTDATPTYVDLVDIPVDGDAYYIDLKVQGRTTTSGEVLSAYRYETSYNNGGSLFGIGINDDYDATAALAAGSITFSPTGTTQRLRIIGVVGKTIQWQVVVRSIYPVPSP